MPRAWLCTVALAFVPTVPSAQPLFTSGVELVYVGVSVADDEGNPVVGLTPDDLEVLEDGAAQEIQYFVRGVHTDADRIPIHLGVLFDASGSMGEEGEFAKTAAIRFLNSMTYVRDMTLVDFDDEVRVGRFGQRDFPRLVERIRNREAGGRTALYDALGVYLDGAFDQDGRKVLLMYSDGADTVSQMPFSDTLDLLRASDVTVYAVGFQKHLSRSGRMLQRMRLEQLAEVTGGRTFFPSDVEELDEIYETIAAELEGRYSIGYVSTNTRDDGTWRELDVRVKETRPELRDLDVRARNGYYAPYRERAVDER